MYMDKYDCYVNKMSNLWNIIVKRKSYDYFIIVII